MMHHSFRSGSGFSMREHRLIHFAEDHEKPADAIRPEHVKDEEFKKVFNELMSKPGSKEEVQKLLLQEFRTNSLGDSTKVAQQLKDRLSNLESLSTKEHGRVKEMLDRIPTDTKSLVKFAADHELFTPAELWSAGMHAGATAENQKLNNTPLSERGFDRTKPKTSPTAAVPEAPVVEQSPGMQGTPVMPPRARSFYDRATRTLYRVEPDGTVTGRSIDQIRKDLNRQENKIRQFERQERSRRMAQGRLIQNWRSNSVSVEHQLNTERTAGALGISPDEMYNPITGTDAAFNRHIKRGVKSGKPVFMNQSGTYAFIDNPDLPRTRIDPRTGMTYDASGQYNNYMASNNPAEVLGMPGANILSDAPTAQEQIFNDARGIYGARANRAPAGNITPFNRYDTNTPESQKQITDFYHGENMRKIQEDFNDLKMHKNPAVREAYHKILTAFNDGIMKRREVTYGDSALARTRLESLRRNGEMMSNNDSIEGDWLEERFYPVHGYAGDAPVRIEFQATFRGHKQTQNISIHDPRMWGDGIYGAKGSADFAKEAGIRVKKEAFANGSVRGVALEFTKPGTFKVISRGPGGKANEEIIVVKERVPNAASKAPKPASESYEQPVPPSVDTPPVIPPSAAPVAPRTEKPKSAPKKPKSEERPAPVPPADAPRSEPTPPAPMPPEDSTNSKEIDDKTYMKKIRALYDATTKKDPLVYGEVKDALDVVREAKKDKKNAALKSELTVIEEDLATLLKNLSATPDKKSDGLLNSAMDWLKAGSKKNPDKQPPAEKSEKPTEARESDKDVKIKDLFEDL